MTTKKKRGSKKRNQDHNQDNGVHDGDNGTTAAKSDTPGWQKTGNPKRNRGGFQSQPRSVGKRYWRM